jgi:hypothetical protein
VNPTDERLERYLHDRSTTIDLSHAGVDAITRGARRHRRRRTAACGGVAVALLLGGVAAAGLADTDDDGREQVSGVAAAVVDSPLEWSVVPVTSGLGWGSGTVSDGGAVYSLSTAPGAEDATSFDDPRHLYRSTDGAEWEDVGLPDGLYASSVSAADGSVYAVGTAAAGGDVVGVELAVSGDGGEGWDSGAVPLDLAALAEGFPGRVRPVDAEVAVGGGTTVVAVSVAGVVDPAQVLPVEDHPPSWYHRQDGLARIQTGSCATGTDPADPSASTTAPPLAPETTTTGVPTTVPHDTPGGTATTTAPVTTTAPAGTEPPPATAPIGPSGAPAGAEPCDPEDEVRTWDELGLTAEQAAVAEGQTHVFAGEAGGPLEPVAVFPGAAFADPSTARLLAADDGWYLVSEAGAAAPDDPAVGRDVVVEHSADGRSWSPITVAAAQGVLSTGVVDGRPVVVAIGSGRSTDAGVEQAVHAHRIDAGGTVTSVDVNRLMDIPSRAGIYAAGVGPLGVAVVVGAGASGEDDRPVVLTSLDGVEWSRSELPEAEAGTRQTVNGVTITPDAITVRLNLRDAADPHALEPAGQRLFVGTPAG